jgi:sugar O-acyltransferase (sialic acid O-acetyltransferase NeuD family)
MYLYGASGHAKVIIENLLSRGYSVAGIFDDNPNIRVLMEYPVLGKYDRNIVGDDRIIISIGNNEQRLTVARRITSEFGTAIHRNAWFSERSEIGCGSVVMTGAIIQPGVIIGEHAIINTAAVVEHDSVIEDFVHISPNATLCGNVKVGEGTHIGAGAVVIPGVNIGKWSIIGAGSVITKNVPDNVVVVGNPGKIIKNR